MDLGFARRHHSRSSAADPVTAYHMLLASVSAQQAVSSTARAQAMIKRKVSHAVPNIFASTDQLNGGTPQGASFHAGIAGAIATEGKSL